MQMQSQPLENTINISNKFLHCESLTSHLSINLSRISG